MKSAKISVHLVYPATSEYEDYNFQDRLSFTNQEDGFLQWASPGEGGSGGSLANG